MSAARIPLAAPRGTPAAFARSPDPGTDRCDGLPLARVRLDADGRILEPGAGWTAITGHEVRGCTGLPLAVFVHPEDRARWDALRARPGAAQPDAVLRFLHADGGLRWVETRVARDGPGLVAGLADVTALARARHALQARCRSLSRLIDELPMMVYRCRNNRLWTMEYVSAGSLALTGYAPEQLVDGRDLHFDQLIHPADREFVWSEVQAALSAMRPFAFDYRLVRADGGTCRVHERGRGLHADDGGEVLGLEGVIMAIDGAR